LPCHYGTFPILTGTPEELRSMTDVEILELEPGGTITV
jgi:L-ascorbate metabolism protein UlaG (beta-lactamase superfamily)